MSQIDEDKWDRIYQGSEDKIIQAADVLRKNPHLLPKNGKALDAACGSGGNALFLSNHGLETYAWDISQVALNKLANKAESGSTNLVLEKRDIVSHPPDTNSFDVIVVSRFLQRWLVSHIINALRKEGLLFYQTFTKARVDETGPENPDIRLDENELLNLFKPLRIVHYREEGLVGNIDKGFRNEAMLIAQKLAND